MSYSPLLQQYEEIQASRRDRNCRRASVDFGLDELKLNGAVTKCSLLDDNLLPKDAKNPFLDYLSPNTTAVLEYTSDGTLSAPSPVELNLQHTTDQKTTDFLQAVGKEELLPEKQVDDPFADFPNASHCSPIQKKNHHPDFTQHHSFISDGSDEFLDAEFFFKNDQDLDVSSNTLQTTWKESSAVKFTPNLKNNPKLTSPGMYFCEKSGDMEEPLFTKKKNKLDSNRSFFAGCEDSDSIRRSNLFDGEALGSNNLPNLSTVAEREDETEISPIKDDIRFNSEKTELDASCLEQLQKKFPPNTSNNNSISPHKKVQRMLDTADDKTNEEIDNAILSAMSIRSPKRMRLLSYGEKPMGNAKADDQVVNMSLNAAFAVGVMVDATSTVRNAIQEVVRIGAEAKNAIEMASSLEKTHNSSSSSFSNKNSPLLYEGNLVDRMKNSDPVRMSHNTLFSSHSSSPHKVEAPTLKYSSDMGVNGSLEKKNTFTQTDQRKGDVEMEKFNNDGDNNQEVFVPSKITKTHNYESIVDFKKPRLCKRFLCVIGSIVSEEFSFRNSSNTAASVYASLIPLSTGCQQFRVHPTVLEIPALTCSKFVITYNAQQPGSVSGIIQFRSILSQKKEESPPYEIIVEGHAKRKLTKSLLTENKYLMVNEDVQGDLDKLRTRRKNRQDKKKSLEIHVMEEEDDKYEMEFDLHPTYIRFRDEDYIKLPATCSSLSPVPSFAIPVHLSNYSSVSQCFEVRSVHEHLMISPRNGLLPANGGVTLSVWPISQPIQRRNSTKEMMNSNGCWCGVLTVLFLCKNRKKKLGKREISIVLDKMLLAVYLPSFREVVKREHLFYSKGHQEQAILLNHTKALYFATRELCYDGETKKIVLKLCNGSNENMTVFLQAPKKPFRLLHTSVTLRPRSYAPIELEILAQQHKKSCHVRAYSLTAKCSVKVKPK